MVAFPKPKRKNSKKLLEMVRRQMCIICQRYGCDPDHITTKGAGGGDTGDNVWPLCRPHHTERHQIGLETFIKKYEVTQEWLVDHERWDILAPIINEAAAKKGKT